MEQQDSSTYPSDLVRAHKKLKLLTESPSNHLTEAGNSSSLVFQLLVGTYTDILDELCLELILETCKKANRSLICMNKDCTNFYEEIIEQPQDEDQRDIFGQGVNDIQTKLNNDIFECVHCKRTVQASRYAPHLERCISYSYYDGSPNGQEGTGGDGTDGLNSFSSLGYRLKSKARNSSRLAIMNIRSQLSGGSGNMHNSNSSSLSSKSQSNEVEDTNLNQIVTSNGIDDSPLDPGSESISDDDISKSSKLEDPSKYPKSSNDSLNEKDSKVEQNGKMIDSKPKSKEHDANIHQNTQETEEDDIVFNYNFVHDENSNNGNSNSFFSANYDGNSTFSSDVAFLDHNAGEYNTKTNSHKEETNQDIYSELKSKKVKTRKFTKSEVIKRKGAEAEIETLQQQSLSLLESTLNTTCGVRSTGTGKLCTKTMNCPQHTDEQRKLIRRELLGKEIEIDALREKLKLKRPPHMLNQH